MSTIQDPRKMWLASGSMLIVWWSLPVSGAEIAPLPSGSGYCTPASLLHTCLSASGGGRGLYTAGLLSFGVHSILRSVSGPGCGNFHGKVFSLSLPLFFPSLAIPQFVFLPQFSSLRLSSRHSGLVFTLSTDVQPMPPCSDPAHW